MIKKKKIVSKTYICVNDYNTIRLADVIYTGFWLYNSWVTISRLLDSCSNSSNLDI
jgi:hypothetical protein